MKRYEAVHVREEILDKQENRQKIWGGQRTQPNSAEFEGKENSAEEKYSFLIHYLNHFIVVNEGMNMHPF